jgi:phospholipase C
MWVPRRKVLHGLGALSASLPFGCRDTTSPGARTPPGARIDHLVLVMMENRSFDHYFGALSLVEGRAGVDGLAAGLSNPDAAGAPVSPSLLAARCLDDPPHGWDASHAQFAEGTNQGFVTEYAKTGALDPALALGYHDRSVLPVSYALADHYTLCQRWFASVMGPTWPNRLYSHGAQSQGMTSNDLPDGQFYSMRTIYDALDEAGVPWSYYWSDAPFLLTFGALGARDEVRPIDEFFADCAAGTLPSVSVVEPAFSFNDDHPPHHPLLGQLFLASVHNALAASPAWEHTLLVITYDEHGGFYDHVPPPTTDDDRVAEGLGQLGFRVPAVVCGPWVRPGAVSDVQLDHTSWLAEIERRFGLDPLTARDAAANDLSSLLDESAGAPLAPAALPVLELTEAEILAECDDGTAARSLHQPELERVLDRSPRRFDVRDRLDRIAREHIARAEALGALRIR